MNRRSHFKHVAELGLLIISFLLLPIIAQSQVSVAPLPVPKYQFFDAAGKPLAFGWVCTFAAGGVIPQVTYTDYTGSVANATCPTVATPASGIHLDSGGFANIWLGPLSYNIFVLNSARTVVWSVDGVKSPTGTLTIANLTVTGNLAVTGNSTFTGTVTGTSFVGLPTVDCKAYAGATTGARIVACIAALPVGGGNADARGLLGGSIPTNPFAGVAKPVRLLLGCGTYTTTTLTMPVTPYVVNIEGSGMRCTILQAASANIPIIKGGPTPTESLRDSFRGFSVKAHASGSTGPAIEMAGFRSSVFEDIEYLTNGTGNFNSFFHFSSHIDAGASHCYGNVVRHPVVDTQTGPTTVFLFDNDGTVDANYQANQNEIQDIWVNANTGITTVVDARRSAQTKVSGGLAEGNAGAVVLIPGTGTLFENVWMELNAAVPIVPATGADGSSNGVNLLNNYFSGGFTLTLGAAYQDWDIRDNYPVGEPTVVDTGTNNVHCYGGICKGLSRFFPRSATELAVRLVPFDDTSPTSPIFSTTNAAQTITAAYIRKNGLFSPSPTNTVAYSATPAFDASLGDRQVITLTANVTSSTLANAQIGQVLNFLICQDGTGAHTFVWPAAPAGAMLGAVVIGATAGKCTAQNFSVSKYAPVTVQNAGDTVTLVAHPFSNGDVVQFSLTANGITAATDYYVCTAAANTFQLDATSAACGAIIPIASDGVNYITSIYPTTPVRTAYALSAGVINM